jgi:hypothetical protein
LIAEGIEIPSAAIGGMYHIAVTLLDNAGKQKAVGKEDFLAVDWRSSKIKGDGAVWEHNGVIKNFLTGEKKLSVNDYTNEAKHLDWVVVSRPPSGGNFALIPTDKYLTVDGKSGAIVSFYKDDRFQEKIAARTDKDINFNVPMGANPDASVTTTERYNTRWETTIVPPVDGDYYLELQSSGKASLLVNGDTLISINKNGGGRDKQPIKLTKGKAVTVSIAMNQIKNSDGKCKLLWAVPETNGADPQQLLDRVANEGTTLILAENADTWMDLISKNTKATCTGKFEIGTAWLGGVFFVKQHPLFKDLPANDGMNWPYQAVVRNGGERFGLEVEGEECVAGAYHAYPMKLGTAVGIIPCGKGKIIFNTLDVCGNLASKESSAEVARKLLCNFIEYGAK